MSSSEKKAWKIFRPAKISFIFTPLSAGHIYDFHIFTVVYSPLHGFIWNQHDDQLPVGLLAQLVEHCTSIAEVMGLNPIQAWIFFQALIFTTAQVVFITAKISFIFMPLSAVQVYDFHIFTVVKIVLLSDYIATQSPKNSGISVTNWVTVHLPLP